MMTPVRPMDPAVAADLLCAVAPSVRVLSDLAGPGGVQVAPTDLETAARFLRDDPRTDFATLSCLTGWDLLDMPVADGEEPSDDLVATWHLLSDRGRRTLALRVRMPRTTPVLPSLHGVWPVADYFEREAWDLLGIVFEGHPDLRRILCPPDWEGHPLRRDYRWPSSWEGVDLRRPGQTVQSGPFA